MAEARNTMTFDGIMSELREGKYRPVYYLMGSEPYYIDQICDYIAEHALRPEERDFNQTVLFGSDVTASTVADAARRYPMMAERQVVIVKEAQNLKQTDALEKYMKLPMKTTVLVMCHKNGKIDGRKKEYIKAIQQVGILFESTKMKESMLPAFIVHYLNERHVAIDPKSTQLIADAIGADLTRLTGELEKVLIALPENDRRVTPQVVEDQIGVSKDFNVFELRNAIVNRDVFKANQIINYFDKNPKAGGIYASLPQLFSYFQNLMLAHYCPQKQNMDAVAEWLEIRPSRFAKDYMTGLRNYSARKTMEIISKLREIDGKSKGIDCPSTPSEELFKELIFYILH